MAFVEGGRLHLVDADGSGETDLAVSTTAPEWFSNDEIAYLAVDGRSVGLITDTGVEGKQLVDAAALDRLGDGWTIESLAVSPENQTIALSIFRNDGAESGIALVGADGGASMLIGPMADPLTGPAFSPDGQALAYVRGVIARVRQLSSADEVAVSPATWHATSPAWSADGDNLVWVANAAELLEGPAAVVVAPVGDPDAVRVVVGSGNGALHQFPAFPDLPLVPVGMDP